MSKKYTTNFLEDTNGSTGSANQVLVSTAAGVDWVDGSGSGIIGGPYLPLTGGTLTGNLKIDQGAVAGNPRLTFDHDNFGTSAYYIEANRSSDFLNFVANGGSRLTLSSTAATFAGDLTVSGGDITLGGATGRIQGIDTISSGTDAVNRNYVDTEIANIPSGLAFEGNWNASTDTPTLAGTTQDNGKFWIVTVAGSTNLSGITDWAVGDWAIYVDNGAGTDAWQKVDNSSTLSGLGAAGKVAFWSTTSNVSFNNNFSYDGTYLTSPRIRVGDGTDGFFYSDSAGRTAFTGGDFYIQSVSNAYNYATNNYHGNTSGDNQLFRGNPLSGNNWNITAAGAISASSTIYSAGGFLVPYAAATKKPMINLAGATTYGLWHTEGSDDIFSFDFGGVSKQQFFQSGNATFTGDLTVSGGDITLGGTGRIQGVDTVSASTDAANKAYVDASVPSVGNGQIDGRTSGLGLSGSMDATANQSGNTTFTVTSNAATAATADTIAYRDSAADLNVRLLRANYANQSTISGAMAYRVNNSTDNYTRYCSSPSAIRTFLGVPASGDLNNYLLDTTDTFTGSLTIIGDIRGSGQQLILNAGESYSYATGQTNEYVYANAEQGLEVSSSPDNWASGWAGRNTTSIGKADGSSVFPGTLYGPGATFYVSGNNSSNLKVGDGSFRMEMGRSSIQARVVGVSGAASSLNLNPNGGDVLFTGSGNVGIGITNPSSKLHVIGQDVTFYSDTGSQSMQVGRNSSERLETYVNDNTVKLTAYQDSDTNGAHEFTLNRAFAGTGSNDFKIQKDGSTQLIVDTNGDVGIGMTSPLHRLSIENSSSPLIKIRNTTNGDGAAIEFNDNGTSAATQNGRISYYHADGQSQGGGSSFWLTGEDDQTLVLANNGRVVVQRTGSSTEVGYGFYDDINTGMYRIGADNLGFATGGVNRLNITNALATFSGDLTVNGGDIILGGVGRVQGIDTVSASTDAVNKAYVDNNAAPYVTFTRTGINSSTYTMIATVNGDLLASIIKMTMTGTSGSVVFACTFDITVNHSQDIHVKSMNGDYTEVTLRITSDNNEDYSIEAKHNGGSTTTAEVCIFPLANEIITPTTTDPGYTGAEYEHTATEGWRFGGEDNNAESSNVIVDGKIGIGTTSPGSSLDVFGTIRVSDGTDNGNLLFRTDRSDVYIKENNYQLTFGAPSGMVFETDTNNNNGDTFRINHRGSARFYLDGTSGNVGIGTTSPTDYGTTANTLEVRGASGTGAGLIRVSNAGNTVGASFYSGSASSTLGTQTAHPLYLSTNNSTKMTILSGGNVGIGTTSPTSALGSTKVLDISSTGNGEVILDHTDAGTASDLGLYSWARNNDHLAHIKATCEGATDAAFISFHAQPSGGSFSNAGSNEKMRIQSNGYVGIGTTSPNLKLDVVSGTNNGIRISATDATSNWRDISIRSYVSETEADALGEGTHIYTSSPSGTSTETPFSYYGATVIQGRDNGNGGFAIRLGNGGGFATRMWMGATGVTVFSNTVTATNFILSSDERLKENIEKACDNRIKADWKTFELKTDKGQKRYGVIAQELEKTNPEFVREDTQGFKSVAYIDLLIAKIAELEARLEKAGI